MVLAPRKVFLTIVLISIWTIVQTILHIFWVIYAYSLSMCRIRPTYYDVVFVYLTYFYKKSCGPIQLRKDTLFMNRTDTDNALFPNESTPKVLYHFLNDTLHNANLPEQSKLVGRTELYLAVLFIADAVWIATAIWMFVGAFCKLKQKCLSIIFYGPWLLGSVFVNFLDVVSSVQYGIDLIYIRSYTSWLKFIGVTNYNDFLSYNDHPSSSVVPAMPTTVMVSLLSRIFILWLLNVICFFVILFLAIPDLFLKTTVILGSSSGASSRGNNMRMKTGEEMNFNSSEARIRNWQLFYGAIEANSTMASPSSRASAATCTENDHNLKNNLRQDSETDKDSGVYNSPAFETNAFELKTTVSSNDTGYRRFSDVASGISMQAVVDTNNMSILKGHIPWSYVKNQQAFNTKPYQKTVGIEDGVTYCTRL